MNGFPMRAPMQLTTPSAVSTRVVGKASPAASALSTLSIASTRSYTPKGMAVTRMTPRNWNPENTWPMAGMGKENPMAPGAAARRSRLMPPMSGPKGFPPHAMAEPTTMATSPAGTPLGYVMPPNQLARMMAKHVSPMMGVVNISNAGRMEMNAME